MAAKPQITIHTKVAASLDKVWECWTMPKHITQWYFASDEWHAPKAENDLTVGGKFLTRMEAKDGSFGFDFHGIYDEIEMHKLICYTLGDARKSKIEFKQEGDMVAVTQTFEAEDTNSIEMQRTGWQAILNNFKKYTESQA